MAWTGKEVETLFICFPDTSVGGPGGVKTVFIVVTAAAVQACAVLSFWSFSRQLTAISPFGCATDSPGPQQLPHYVQAVATLDGAGEQE